MSHNETNNQSEHPSEEHVEAEMVDIGEPSDEAVSPEVVASEEKSDAEKLAELQDKYLRQAAELENFKKRMEREADRRVSREREGVILEWLNVVDSLERALGCCGEADPAITDGIRKVLDQAESVLKARGITRMHTDGALFDSNLHEALTTIPSPQHENGTVLHTERAGYQRGDESVLRPARVVVVKNG